MAENNRKNPKKKKIKEIPIKKLRRRMKERGFHFVRKLGKGGYGTVYEAIKIGGKQKGQVFSVKKISIENQNSINREIDVQERVSSSIYIPKYHCRYSTKQDTYLVFDFMEGGSLLRYLHDYYPKKGNHFMTEFEVKPYLHRIIKGIEELHNNRVIHRDIKLSNIVLDDDCEPYIIDFGSARIFGEGEVEETKGISGTIPNCSPEMIENKPYSYETDWWSFGVCAFEMVVGKHPFSNNDASKKILKRRILNNMIRWKELDYLTADATDFLKGLLCNDPQKRLGKNGSEEIWNHPFIARSEDSGAEGNAESSLYSTSSEEGNAESSLYSTSSEEENAESSLYSTSSEENAESSLYRTSSEDEDSWPWSGSWS